ncbi:MAG: hypothetical protein HYZ28_11810 [Myxococcales bacterium]|nr:hypothetical protein [Myxococcales bacterium]
MRPLLIVLVLVPGCIRDDRAARERGGAAIFDAAPEVKAPLSDRCKAHGQSSARQSCEEAKYLAQTYARGLSTLDAVCLEGGFGEAPGASCLTRASVADADGRRVLLEIRGARPESRWFQQVQSQVWFEEGALVDLYLAEHGY